MANFPTECSTMYLEILIKKTVNDNVIEFQGIVLVPVASTVFELL